MSKLFLHFIYLSNQISSNACMMYHPRFVKITTTHHDFQKLGLKAFVKLQ